MLLPCHPAARDQARTCYAHRLLARPFEPGDQVVGEFIVGFAPIKILQQSPQEADLHGSAGGRGGVIAAAIRSAIAQTSSPILSDFGSSAGQAEYHASNASCSAPSTITMSAGRVPKAKWSGAGTGEGRGTLVGPEQGEDARAGKGMISLMLRLRSPTRARPRRGPAGRTQRPHGLRPLRDRSRRP